MPRRSRCRRIERLPVYRSFSPDDAAAAEAYMNRFIDRNGSVVCRELLGYDLTDPAERKIIQDKNLFKTKCPEMVRNAVQILEEMFAEKDRL